MRPILGQHRRARATQGWIETGPTPEIPTNWAQLPPAGSGNLNCSGLIFFYAKLKKLSPGARPRGAAGQELGAWGRDPELEIPGPRANPIITPPLHAETLILLCVCL